MTSKTLKNLTLKSEFIILFDFQFLTGYLFMLQWYHLVLVEVEFPLRINIDSFFSQIYIITCQIEWAVYEHAFNNSDEFSQ